MKDDYLHCLLSHAHKAMQHPQKRASIPDVPSECAKLATVLHDSMEKTHTEQQLSPCIGLVAVGKIGIVQSRELANEITLKTFGGLESHFNAILEHSNREGGGWHGCQPQSEVAVHL